MVSSKTCGLRLEGTKVITRENSLLKYTGSFCEACVEAGQFTQHMRFSYRTDKVGKKVPVKHNVALLSVADSARDQRCDDLCDTLEMYRVYYS